MDESKQEREVLSLLFDPKELDIRALREMPEINIANITAIPEDALKRGFFTSRETAEKNQKLK